MNGTKKKFAVDPKELARDLGFMTRELEQIGDKAEWSGAEIDELDEMRLESMRLYDAIEAILDQLSGE